MVDTTMDGLSWVRKQVEQADTVNAWGIRTGGFVVGGFR